MFPSQHPWHVLDEHGMPHTPATHTWFAFWQSVHDAPPVPQIVSSVPAKQMPPSEPTPQQPFGQFCGVQAVPGLHSPPMQNVPEPQVWQTTPFCPHAGSVNPETQIPFWQHPLGHVSGPQCWSVHVPPTPASSGMHWPVPLLGTQLVHCCPPLPHAAAALPAAQSLSPRQQP
jgi:hypothetical protein